MQANLSQIQNKQTLSREIQNHLQTLITIYEKSSLRKHVPNTINHILHYLKKELSHIKFHQNTDCYKIVTLRQISAIVEQMIELTKKELVSKKFFDSFGRNEEFSQYFQQIQAFLDLISDKFYLKNGEKIDKSKVKFNCKPENLKKIDTLIQSVQDKKNLSMAKDELLNELTFATWLSDAYGDQDKIASSRLIKTLIETLKQLEDIQIGNIQKQKIEKSINPHDFTNIPPKNLDFFFNSLWSNKLEKASFLNNEEIMVITQDLQQVKLTLKLISADQAIMNSPFTEDLRSENGVQIDQSGIIPPGQQLGNGNGVINILRKENSHNSISLIHTAVGKKQAQIIYNPLDGFNLMCIADTNLTQVFLKEDQFTPITEKMVLVLLDTFQIEVLQVSKEQNNNNAEINNNKNPFGFIPSVFKSAKEKFFKQLIKKEEKTNKKNKKAQEKTPFLKLKVGTDIEGEDDKIKQQEIIIQAEEFILGKPHINDAQIEDQCLLFKQDQKTKQWNVKCIQNNDKYLISFYLKNFDQQYNDIQSDLYQIQNGDKFGILCGDEITPIVLQCDIETQGQILECQTCMMEFEINEDLQYFNLFNCDHFICRYCQLQTIQGKLDFGRLDLDYYRCLSVECEEKVKIDKKLKEIAPEVYDAIKNGENKLFSIQCPNEKCKKSLLNKHKEGTLTCENCTQKICAKCNQKSHEGMCKRAIRENLRNLKGFDQIVRFCPKCYSIFAKDDNCDHVTCRNCKTDFCFRCSAFREPTLAHGNHYHRSDCTFYSKYDVPEYKPDKCSFCQIFKKACPQPKSYTDFIVDLKAILDCGDETIKVIKKKEQTHSP